MTDIFYEDAKALAMDRVALMPGLPLNALIRDLYGPNPTWRERTVITAVWDLIEEGKLVVIHPGNGVYASE